MFSRVHCCEEKIRQEQYYSCHMQALAKTKEEKEGERERDFLGVFVAECVSFATLLNYRFSRVAFAWKERGKKRRKKRREEKEKEETA